MKNLVAIVAVIGIAVAAGVWADYNCFVHDYACADEGDKCVGDFIVNGSECDNKTNCCAFPLYCVNGTCMEETRDTACNSTEDCLPAVFGTHLIACIKGKCVVQGNFNDSCTKDDHCAGDQICEKGLCSGLNFSAQCDPHLGYQCGYNLSCVNHECELSLPIGQVCIIDLECDVYSICNAEKCTERYSVKLNESCDREDACEIGLYCDMSIHKCAETVQSQYIPCKNDTDCAGYGNTSVCSICNAETGEMFCSDPVNVERDCAAELAAAYKCYRKNGCAPVITNSLDTCAMLECTAETNAVFTCRSVCEDQKRVAGAKCLAGIMLRYCPLLPTWLRIVLAFSVLIAIIVVVFTAYGIYRCCGKKKNPNGYEKVPGSTETPQ